MVPFDRKLGDWVNGYRIGTYLSERFGGHDRPEGFVEVTPSMLDLAITKHLKLSDFVTHDDQDNVWPKYVALNPRLLDKLELVVADVGARGHPNLRVDVHSGFRAPDHNRKIRRAARDSQHQYGDAERNPDRQRRNGDVQHIWNSQSGQECPDKDDHQPVCARG